MNYSKRQSKSKLTDYYIAKSLNLRVNEYKDFKSGKRAFAKEKLDIFLELTDPKNQYYLDQEIKINEAIAFFNAHTSEEIYGILKSKRLNGKMIAKDTGCSQSSITEVIAKHSDSAERKLVVYDYIQDDNNIRYIPKKKQESVEKPVENLEVQQESVETVEIVDNNDEIERPYFLEETDYKKEYFELKRQYDRLVYLIDIALDK